MTMWRTVWVVVLMSTLLGLSSSEAFAQTAQCDPGWKSSPSGGCEQDAAYDLANLPMTPHPSLNLLYASWFKEPNAPRSPNAPRTLESFGIARTQFDVAPNAIYKIDPIYTEEAFQAHLQGEVILSVTVATNGIPTNIVVQQSLGGGLDEAATAALSRCRFKPGYKDGQPIPVNAVLTYTFTIPPPAHPKLGKALAIGAKIYLGFVCPQVRRRPVILLNTNEQQLLQACIAAGF